MSKLRFFNPYAEIRHTGSRLPHWQQEGAVYFVTFRLVRDEKHFRELRPLHPAESRKGESG